MRQTFASIALAVLVSACSGAESPAAPGGPLDGAAADAPGDGGGTADAPQDTGPGPEAAPGDGLPADAPPCGALGQPCCSGTTCDVNFACEADVCAQARPQETGTPCSHNSDCQSGICLPVGQPTAGHPGWTGNVCTTTCTAGADCVAGWTCEALLGQPTTVCQCHYRAEACDAADNDCDGIVDNQLAADGDCAQRVGGGYGCASGACECLVECDGTCVNAKTDVTNCGSCGHVCPANNATATCVDATCHFTCKTYSADCDSDPSNACEVLRFSDPNNCVECGRSCNGTACGSAGCEAEMLNCDTSGGSRLALDEDFVYWAASGSPSSIDGTVNRIAKTGGDREILATAQDHPSAIAVDGTHVYWINNGSGADDGSVMRVAKTGGTATPLATGQYRPGGIAIDAVNVYWPADQTLYKVPLVGGTPTPLATVWGPGPIVIDATNAYGIFQGAAKVWKAPLAGGDPVVLADNQAALAGIAVYAGNVYWGSNNSVVKVAVSGGSPVTLTSGLNSVEALTVDGTGVYVADWDRVARVPLAGGIPFYGYHVYQTGGGGMALDHDSLFIHGDCVQKVAK